MSLSDLERQLGGVTHSSQLKSVVSGLIQELKDSYRESTLEYAPDPDIEALKSKVAELEERVTELEDAPSTQASAPAKKAAKKAQR